jgi:ParB family chromosome partitioning protein
VRELTSQQIAEISLIENLHREDLNAIEAAEGMRELMENHNLTQEGVAGRIGKSRPYVTNTLRLLQLPKEVNDMVKEGRLSPGHARALISIDDKNYLIQLAKQACDSHLSVRDLETKVRLYFTRKTIPVGPRKQPLPIELKEMVGDMKRVFATKVKLMGNENKGRICIDYFNKDDLDRIHEIIQRLKYEEKL